ncbi:MAG: hypothetical protein ABSF99_13625, partial [Anaerolineales bacterium]
DALPNAKPYVPTGAAYTASGWSPTVEEINDFMNTAKALGLPAVNFFNWDTCRQYLPLIWTTIANFAWSTPAAILIQATSPVLPQDDFLSQFLAALNSRQAAQISTLYDPAAIQVWADKILSNTAAIQNSYATFFENLTPGTAFTLSQAQMIDDMAQFSWKVDTLTGETTLVLKGGKIILDYTFFS